jgi:hypothetical protein
MIARFKCSQCGAEMSNLTMNWGWKHWLVTIPLMLLCLYPALKLTVFKGDATKELAVSEISKRTNDRAVDIIGLITNQGRHKWSSVTIKAEFYDADGHFLDENTEYLRSEVAPGAREHFKMSFRTSEPKVLAADVKMVVKVSGGMSMPF